MRVIDPSLSGARPAVAERDVSLCGGRGAKPTVYPTMPFEINVSDSRHRNRKKDLVYELQTSVLLSGFE